MSDYESHFGKLRKVDLQGKSKEEFFKEKCFEAGTTEMKGEDWQETAIYYSDYYEKYFFKGDDVWEVFDHESSYDYGYFKILDNGDGTYTFAANFYNGGTCLSEIIEEELEKL